MSDTDAKTVEALESFRKEMDEKTAQFEKALAEKDGVIAEKDEKIAEFAKSERFAKVQSEVKEFFDDSEDVDTTGDEATEAIVAFGASLDETQYESFMSILKSLRAYNAEDKEEGSGEAGEEPEEKTEEEVTTEEEAKESEEATEMAKEKGIPYRDALKKVRAKK